MEDELNSLGSLWDSVKKAFPLSNQRIVFDSRNQLVKLVTDDDCSNLDTLNFRVSNFEILKETITICLAFKLQICSGA